MFITSLKLKNFRCFSSYEASFEQPVVLICGPNGSGKTSLLESLYYACYLKSFKTKTTRELVGDNADAFSIKLDVSPLAQEAGAALALGYSPAKRIIKLNDILLKSHKDLLTLYRVVAMTDEDLTLVKGYPEVRRSFVDAAISLVDPTYPRTLRKYVHIVQQRTALLANPILDKESYEVWTAQLHDIAEYIRSKRVELLGLLEIEVNKLLALFFNESLKNVKLIYEPKTPSFDITKQERAAQRTLIGAHLDDFQIVMQAGSACRSSRIHASRGQQKLLALLLKVAQPAVTLPQSCLFLLDDIACDLDTAKFEQFFDLIASHNTQIIITSPLTTMLDNPLWKRYVPQVITLGTL